MNSLSLKQALEYAINTYGEKYITPDSFKKKLDFMGALAPIDQRKQGKALSVDKDAMDNYYKILSSPLHFATACKDSGITYNRLYYICMKYNIELTEIFARKFFKTTEDKDNAIRLATKS